MGLAAAPWTVSQSAQIDAIEKEIKSGSSVRLVSHGRSVFAVLPRPHIRIYDVNLDFEEGVAEVTASSLRVDLGLSGLFTGRLDLARVTLADAVLTLDPARSRLASIVAGAPGKTRAPPGEVEVTNGTALLRRDGGEKPELIADDCEARLDFSRASAPVSLIGHCVLPLLGDDRSPTRFAVWAAKPDNLPRGEESPITLRADGDALQINLNGAFALAPKPHFRGRIAGAAPSLRRISQWFGLTLPLPGHYRNVSIKGDATLEPMLMSIAPLSVTIDGNSLDGAASVRLDGPRPLIAATLAGSDVNLGPMFEDVPAPTAGGQWSHDEFLPSRLGAADLDLRLSASHARLGDFQAENVAVSAILKNGRLDLSLAEASAYSGEAHARAIVAESGDGLDVRGSAAAEKIDVAALLWDLFRRQSLSAAIPSTTSRASSTRAATSAWNRARSTASTSASPSAAWSASRCRPASNCDPDARRSTCCPRSSTSCRDWPKSTTAWRATNAPMSISRCGRKFPTEPWTCTPSPPCRPPRRRRPPSRCRSASA